MPVRKSSYSALWETERPWLKPVKDNEGKAYCGLCKSQFNVDNGGEFQLGRHEQGKKHKKQ